MPLSIPKQTYPYAALYRLARELHRHNLDAYKIVQTALDEAAALTQSEQGCLVTFQDAHTIDKAHVIGTGRDDTAPWQSLLWQGLIGHVYHAQRVVVIHNIAVDPRWPPVAADSSLPRHGSAIGLPLPRGAGVSGVLLLCHPEVAHYDEQAVALLVEIAELTTDALNNALDVRNLDAPERRYQTRFKEAPVPMLLTDLEGQVLNINAEALDLLGLAPASVIGSSVTRVHPVDLDALCSGGSLHRLRLNEETTLRSAFVTATGDAMPALLRLRRLRVDEQDVVEWVAQDMSAQMALEQLRRDLTAMVYHDLRGPLQTVRGSINRMAQVLANHENPAVLTLLQLGIRGTRQLSRMIDSLLDVQRLEEGRAMLNLAQVEPRVLLADATQLVQPLVLEAGQQLRFALQDALPMAVMDSDMMLRVVINLLENAVKYTPSGGVITLGAAVEGQEIRFSVADSGPGIPPEMQQTIFDKFNRVKYQNAPKGVGLGLAFCRLAVEAHGGRIWVESEPGQGATFIASLPLNTPQPDETDTAEPSLATTA